MEIVNLGPRYAFIREFDDGTWCVAIVGHTERCLPDSGAAEVLDANVLPTAQAASAWLREQDGFDEVRFLQ